MSTGRVTNGGQFSLWISPDLASKTTVCVFSFGKNLELVIIHDPSVKEMHTDQTVSVFGVVSLWAKYGSNIPFVCFAAIAFCGTIAALFLPETLDEKLPQSVQDVEQFISKRPFFSCGRLPDATPDSFPPCPPSLSGSILRKRWIDPVEIRCLSKRNSLDSVVGIFVVPSHDHTNIV
ncbi:MFS domain-containing protein [Trichonephila clavipes]|nr:MFS domain-containing protein [Trichonephila clavipes]